MNITASPARIVLVEDDADVARTTRRVLSTLRDVIVETCYDVTSAKRALELPFDVIVSDFNLPDGTGVDVLRAAANASESAPAIVITGDKQWASATAAINDGGAFRVLGKPVPPELLTATVRDALAAKKTRDILADERLVALPALNDRERLIRTLGRAIDRRLGSGALRAESLAHIGRAFADKLGLPMSVRSTIELTILAHRIGTVALRDDESAALVPVLGAEILRTAGFPSDVVDAVAECGEAAEASSVSAHVLAISTRYLEATAGDAGRHDEACTALLSDESLDAALVASFVLIPANTWSLAAAKTIPYRPIAPAQVP